MAAELAVYDCKVTDDAPISRRFTAGAKQQAALSLSLWKNRVDNATRPSRRNALIPFFQPGDFAMLLHVTRFASIAAMIGLCVVCADQTTSQEILPPVVGAESGGRAQRRRSAGARSRA
jgi:hypothetical protein